MSARTDDGEEIPPVPEGWKRVRPGRPLIKHEEMDKLRLQWCPKCGPRVTFHIEGKVQTHIETHFPEDFGLGQSRTGIMGYSEEVE